MKYKSHKKWAFKKTTNAHSHYNDVNVPYRTAQKQMNKKDSNVDDYDWDVWMSTCMFMSAKGKEKSCFYRWIYISFWKIYEKQKWLYFLLY